MTRYLSEARNDLTALNCHCKTIDRAFMQAATTQANGVNRDGVPLYVQVKCRKKYVN